MSPEIYLQRSFNCCKFLFSNNRQREKERFYAPVVETNKKKQCCSPFLLLLLLYYLLLLLLLSPSPPLSCRLEKFLGGAPKASYRHSQKHSGILLVELVGFWWWMNPSLAKLLLKKRHQSGWGNGWSFIYFFISLLFFEVPLQATQENVSRVAADSDNVCVFLGVNFVI